MADTPRRALAVRRRGLALGVIAAAGVACTVPRFGESSRIVYGSGGAIVELAPDGSSRRVRVQPPTGGIARDPAWSPDTTRIAYAYTPPIVATRNQSPEAMMPVSDLYLLDVASGETRLLHAHGAPGEAFERPVWTPDGAAVVASFTAPIIEDGVLRGVREAAVRVSVTDATAAPVPLGTGVQDVAISRDGQRLAWVHRVPEGRVVEVASADGAGATVVVPADAVDGAAWPRFSPDGRRLVFSANAPFTPAPTVTPLPRRAWFGDVAAAAAMRHGLPMDVFTVRIDGTGLTRITTVGEDSPQATWSVDGTKLAIVSGGGTYVLRLGTIDLETIDTAGGHGAIDWR